IIRLISIVSLATAAPIKFLPTETVELHQQGGRDVKSAVPGMASLGFGDVTKTISRYTPENQASVYSENIYNSDDRPNLGYMDRETAGGRSTGSKNLVNLPGLGRFEYGEEREQGTGILDFSKTRMHSIISKLFPFLQLPPLKEERPAPTKPLLEMDEVKRENLGRMLTPKQEPRSFSPFGPSLLSDDILPEGERPAKAFQEIPSIVDANAPIPSNQPSFLPSSTQSEEGFTEEKEETKSEEAAKSENPFDDIAIREIMLRRLKAARRSPLDGKPIKDQKIDQETRDRRRKEIRRQVDTLKASMGAPASELGIGKRELHALCARFAPIAEQQCYKAEVASEFVDKCRGYQYDCQEFMAQSRPLGAIANSFSSGVGLTYYSWGVNGIPYYPVNEEGAVGGGSHGKVDFGSYGGGYSYNNGVRDFFTQTGEAGANWFVIFHYYFSF
ncbi:hypothetical protein PMAYCL1PPCAC_06339, partial [Pristionchus mayeri]